MHAIYGCPILIGDGFIDEHAVLISEGRIHAVMPMSDLDDVLSETKIHDGMLVPGFIDLQVNGGGGVLFNDDPSIEAIKTIGEAHRQFGTTGFLPTLISDTPDVIERAILAVKEAMDANVPGVLGIHIEGPVLNPDKKGVHDDARFRILDDAFIDLLASLGQGKTLVTLAPEKVDYGQITKLVDAGVVVWAGHTDADYATVKAAVDAGLSGFTHLYNAMSPLTSRAPGVVGAALDLDDTYVGVIADGYHVSDASLRIALKCKTMDKMVLVSDAMPSVGAGAGFEGFDLFGEWVDARGDRLTIAAGNLAGSSLEMNTAVCHAHAHLGVSLAEAVKMASMTPARAIGVADRYGEIAKGKVANMVHLNEQGRVTHSWIDGHVYDGAAASVKPLSDCEPSI